MFEGTGTFLKVIPLFMMFQAVSCSIVVDNFSQQGINVSDYCPHMEYCPEGAHVMCQYYDPNHEMGPRCGNPQNTSMTNVLANQILDILNAIRSKIATGRETGRNGTQLPRGYGIFRLKWDTELATFAQVFANQCIFQRDFCRASRRFPEPEQTAGIIRYRPEDWMPVEPVNIKLTPGLDDAKLAYTVTEVLRSWYSLKMDVSEDMIVKYSPINRGNIYTKIILGELTHVGCGISAYSDFSYYIMKASLNYNCILIICNLSSSRKPGEVVYSVMPAPGSSSCGCPEGTHEDSDCLCNEMPTSPRPTAFDTGTQTETETCPNQEGNCEPTLVLLPIFTIEDAPPDRLGDRVNDVRDPLSSYITDDRLYNGSNQMYRTANLKMNDFFADPQRSFQQQFPSKTHSISPSYQRPIVWRPPQTNYISHLSPLAPTQNKVSSPRRSYKNEILESPHRRISQSPRQKKRQNPASKKSSIFNRVAQFKLPTKEKKSDQYEPIKHDVKPRKDFKNIQKVVNDYIQQRNNKFRKNGIIANKHQENLKKVTLRITPKIEDNTETILNNVEEKVISFDHFDGRNKISIDDNIKHLDFNYGESDNKLMTLLDTLEREVKHIELDGNEKEIFDAKIRKIYDTVVGKPETLLTSNPKSNLNYVPNLKVHTLPSELLESDFGESNTYIKHASNHITESYGDIRIRHESDHLLEDNTDTYKQTDKLEHRARDYEYIDSKYNDNLDRTQIRKEDKPSEVYDTKPYYNNDIVTKTDHKISSDIENKYNERFAAAHSRRKLDQTYQETSDKFGSKRNVFGNHNFNNMPTHINRNHVGKYENQKPQATSEEARKYRALDKNRERESISNIHVNSERNYLRTGQDDKKRVSGNRKKGNDYQGGNEVDHENDPLSAERRKYYQDKLETLERRLRDRSVRRNKYDDKPNERAFRRMRPNREQPERPRSKMQGDSFYMPDRARFLHGF